MTNKKLLSLSPSKHTDAHTHFEGQMRPSANLLQAKKKQKNCVLINFNCYLNFSNFFCNPQGSIKVVSVETIQNKVN